MARIPQTEIERLKQEISLERLVEAKGIKLKRHGQDRIGLCPFHDDKEPSLVISPKRNLWHCLGACQAGGSVIDWVMKAEGVSFRHAVELLREDSPSLAAELRGRRGGRLPADGAQRVKKSTVTHLKTVIDAAADRPAALRQAIDYYHETLKESPEALAYLEKRGLKSNEMIEAFRLGFCDRTLCYRLPHKNRKDGAPLRAALREVGILRQSGHEHFRGSIVVPVFDAEGQVVEMYGRKINHKLRRGTPKHLYLPGPHRGVWNVAAMQASQEMILCEALLDALTFWCAGYRNVTSAYGIEGFTAEIMSCFETHGTKRVLIAYDRDEAGDKAAAKVAKQLMSRGIDAFRIQFPKGMDANAYALSVGPARKSLDVAIRGAVWLGQGRAPEVYTALAAKTPPAVLATTDPLASHTGPDQALLPPPAASSLPAVPNPPPAPTPAEAKAPSCDVPAWVDKDEVVLRFGDRRWRVRGLMKNTSYAQMRVNVLCCKADAFHVDSFDLYSSRHRNTYLKQASDELGLNLDVLKKDLGKVLLKLEELQDAHIQATLTPQNEAPSLSDKERDEALALLQDPHLVERILSDFELCGVVGEETNKLVGFLAATSRKLEEPLAVIIQSSSAAGKSSLMDAVLALMPEEERVQYSAMTGQSLFYMGETDLQHKILAIVEEEGAERASYALKLLQSEGALTIASTGKDPATGQLLTHDYHVQGPVMIFLTTTAIEIDEELLNRCLVLTVNEERAQTRAIHGRQRRRRTLQGRKQRHQRDEVLALHRNAQRLLRPLCVVNPYAEHLTFLDDRTRTRRDHEKYLTLIDSVALLYQYQRPVQAENFGSASSGNTAMQDYIEVTLSDIELANTLAHEVLGRSLDELPPQTRRLLERIHQMVVSECEKLAMGQQDYRFSRRQVREHTGWGHTQLKIHLQRLEDFEYLIVHRGARGQRYVYELLYDGQGQDGARFLPGLLDVSQWAGECEYDAKKSGPKGNQSGPGRPVVGPRSGGGRGALNGASAENDDTNPCHPARSVKNAHPGPQKSGGVAVEEDHTVIPASQVQ